MQHCQQAGWSVEGMVADVSLAEDRQRLVARAAELFGGKLGALPAMECCFTQLGRSGLKAATDVCCGNAYG